MFSFAFFLPVKSNHWSLTLSSLLCFSRGHSKASQWAIQEQLHGAEFSRPQPSAQHPHQPGLRGTGQEERCPDRPGAGTLGRQPCGWAVGCSRHLCRGPDCLPGHAGLLQEPLELLKPWPQIPNEIAACWWAHQVAARPPAGQEAARFHSWFFFFFLTYLRAWLQLLEEENVFLLSRETKGT